MFAQLFGILVQSGDDISRGIDLTNHQRFPNCDRLIVANEEARQAARPYGAPSHL